MAELEGTFRPSLAQFPHLGGETEVLCHLTYLGVKIEMLRSLNSMKQEIPDVVYRNTCLMHLHYNYQLLVLSPRLRGSCLCCNFIKCSYALDFFKIK